MQPYRSRVVHGREIACLAEFMATKLRENSRHCPLRQLGYTVSYGCGLSVTQRRSILRLAFEGPDPFRIHPSWGKPRTVQRLKSICSALTRFVSLWGGRDCSGGEDAVGEWTADLRWLESDLLPQHQSCLLVEFRH